MKALVVGGTGFLGLNLAEALLARGDEVASTRRRSSNTLFARRLGVPLVAADLDDAASLEAAMDGVHAVFFCAGHYPRYAFDTGAEVDRGVRGVRAALDAAKRAGVDRFVYVGSVATVATPADDRPVRESDGLADVPDGFTYHAVKIAMERAVQEAVEQGGPEVVLALPTGCVGPYDWKVGTSMLVLGPATGRLEVFVDGRINVIDARDVALSLVAAALEGRAGERYILGGHDVTVAAFLDRVCARLGVPLPARRLEPDAARVFADAEEARCREAGGGRPRLSREMVDLAVHGHFADASKAKAELALSPRSLDETIDDTFRWYRDNGFVRTEKAELRSAP